ncbi:MAG: hypothetical protein AABY68_06500 [Pseudomonadota bacterium]
MKKRDLFSELMQGIHDMAKQRKRNRDAAQPDEDVSGRISDQAAEEHPPAHKKAR